MSEVSTALEPVAAHAVDAPLPIYGAEAMARAFAEYGALQSAIDRALADCIIVLDGKPYRKKSYWRAVGVGYHLSVECVEERYEVRGAFHDGTDNFGYLVTYRATAPNGRSAVGDGACFCIERAARDPELRWRTQPLQATEHNIRSTAHTRGFNRAISNLCGFGEVSAEEIERDERDDRPPQVELPGASPAPRPRAASPSQGVPALISTAQKSRLWAIGKGNGWADADIRSLVKRYGFDHGDDITRAAYDAICDELGRGPGGDR